jgi:hypothetical protein
MQSEITLKISLKLGSFWRTGLKIGACKCSQYWQHSHVIVSLRCPPEHQIAWLAESEKVFCLTLVFQEETLFFIKLHGSSQDSKDLIPMVTLLRRVLVCEYGLNYLLMQSPHVVEYQCTQLICVICSAWKKI